MRQDTWWSGRAGGGPALSYWFHLSYLSQCVSVSGIQRPGCATAMWSAGSCVAVLLLLPPHAPPPPPPPPPTPQGCNGKIYVSLREQSKKFNNKIS